MLRPGVEAMAERAPVPGDHLQCGSCGTAVRVEHVGGGRLDCCEQPLTRSAHAAVGTPARAHARCSGCGNEVTVEHDGGGSLECCHRGMLRS